MRIIFFGDSLTEGVYGGNYIKTIQKLLPEHEIINKGVGGDTTLNLLERLESILALEPDLVYVMVGGNDAISYCQPKTRQYYRQSKAVPEGMIDIDVFERAYRDLLTQLQAHHILVLAGFAPIEHNTTLIDTMRGYSQVAQKITKALNIPFLDLSMNFKPDTLPERDPLGMHTILTIGSRTAKRWKDYETERQKEGFTFTFDGLHLTNESAEKMGEIIAGFIKENI